MIRVHNRHRCKSTVLILLLAVSIASCSATASTSDTFQPSAPQSREADYKLPELTGGRSPFKIAILGDNTAKLDGGWTNIFANWVSDRFNRTVLIRAIESADSMTYSEIKTIDKGSETPIEIWVAAVPNLTIQQLQERISILLPFTTNSSPDLIIFNQGHNVGSRSLAKSAIPILKQLCKTYTETAILTILQNPWLPEVDQGNVNDLNIQDLKTSTKNSGFQAIDVHAAFQQDGRPLKDLLDTGGTFPNADGYILWAQTLESELS